ncbi:MAG: hypothetical protein WBI32_00980 [Halanaerobiales bacterium]
MKALKLLKMKRRMTDPATTGWAISGLGLLVTAIGAKMVDKRLGAGILGFGLAHIVLGQLDRCRPTIKKNSWC